MAREYGMDESYSDILIDEAVRVNPKLVRTAKVLRVFAYAGGAAFGAMLVSILILSLTGAVSLSSWHDAISILRQRAVAVDVKTKDELEHAQRERDEFIKRPSEVELVEAWGSLKAERRDFENRLSLEKEVLSNLANEINHSINLLEAKERLFDEKQKAVAEKLRQSEESLSRAALDKIRRIYRAMSPKAVAEDLEKRMSDGRTQEVAVIVSRMNDRSVAEVLENFRDAALRLKVYDAMKSKNIGGAE